MGAFSWLVHYAMFWQISHNLENEITCSILYFHHPWSLSVVQPLWSEVKEGSALYVAVWWDVYRVDNVPQVLCCSLSGPGIAAFFQITCRSPGLWHGCFIIKPGSSEATQSCSNRARHSSMNLNGIKSPNNRIIVVLTSQGP